MAKKAITYKQAGVDLDAGAAWVERIRPAMAGTFTPRVQSRHGAFAGVFRLDFAERLFRRDYRDPLLVGCADGVGTKVLLAAEADSTPARAPGSHRRRPASDSTPTRAAGFSPCGALYTVGIDLVAMNVNDMITCGAEPLFFLDYLAVHKLDPQWVLQVIEGIAEGCRQAGCALLGGETAEMPDLYRKGHLDLAGFAVGVVESRRFVDPRRVTPGDLLIALRSSGVHSNGYTLVRKLLKRNRVRLHEWFDELNGTVADALLTPTRIYVEPVLAMLKAYRVKRVITGMAHITGGGLPENLARILPADCDAVIRTRRWTPPAVFTFLRKLGVDRREMFGVFNMGVGFVLAVRPAFARGVMRKLERTGEKPFVIGYIRRGTGTVELR